MSDLPQKPVLGTVVAIEGHEAVVEVAHGGCGRCHEPGGCGGVQLTQALCVSPRHYRLPFDGIPLAAGDRVVIDIAPGAVRRTANLVYGLPLLATVLGAAVGTALADDLGGVLGALCAATLAFLQVRRRSRTLLAETGDRPHIISRSSPSEVSRS